MKTAIIIPAAYGSAGCPGKPLAVIRGKPLVQHVHELARKVKGVSDIVVATDDMRIKRAAEGFGGVSVTVATSLCTGTECVVEAMNGIDADIYLNLHCDACLVTPEALSALITAMEDPSVHAATFCHEIDERAASDADVVKVVVDSQDYALFFSRSPIHHPRAGGKTAYLRHIGIYAYRKSTLDSFRTRSRPGYEKSPVLEQIRLLDAGIKLKALKVSPVELDAPPVPRPDAPPSSENPQDHSAPTPGGHSFLFGEHFMDAVDAAKHVISDQIQALELMRGKLDGNFLKALDLIQSASGRVVVLGIGKSGIIGKKIAATLASTGTPSFFVHPGEAFHGDLGMIRPIDIALMISNSGETEELIRLLPFLREQGNPTIALTGALNSTLARHSDAVLDVSAPREACTNNLAPTSSTTTTLVMGDAIAIVLSSLSGFRPEDFARFHPGGSLGRRLLTRVADVMRRDNLPICGPETIFRDVVHHVNAGRLGLVLVMEGQVLLGVITDGDIRRAFDRHENPMILRACDILSPNPHTIRENGRLAEAESLMMQLKIGSLLVTNDSGQVTGVLQIYSTNI